MKWAIGISKHEIYLLVMIGILFMVIIFQKKPIDVHFDHGLIKEICDGTQN